MSVRRRKTTFPTVTDLFCGAGGSSFGAVLAGVEIRGAGNHWQRACDTYATNHGVEPICADLSQSDPRAFARTDILIASPECTNHSLAKGVRRKNIEQDDLFGCDLCRRHGESNCPKHSDPIVRSRAGGWDVAKFVEHHRYEIVILENVVDWLEWQDFPIWWRTLENLGYVGQKVFFNSMFAPPTPQSRDRLYIVWSKKRNRRPDTDLRALAFCPQCDRDGRAIQIFKPGGSAKARYGRQYFYTCPTCAGKVQPYYFAAINAIDPTIPSVPIGERAKHGLPPLKPRTRDRLQYGIDRYGSQPLVITVNQTNRLGGRVRPASSALFTQPASGVHGVAAPFFVDTTFSHDESRSKTVAADAPLNTQNTRQAVGVATPFVLHMQGDRRVHALEDHLSTQVASCPQDALVSPSPFMVSTNEFDPRNVPVSDPRPTQTTQTKFGVAMPPGFMINAGSNAFEPRSVDGEIPTLTGSDRCAFVLSPGFIASLRGTSAEQVPYTTAPLHASLGTISAGGVHAAIVNLRDWRNTQQLCSSVTDTMPTQVASAQTGVVSRFPFIVSYYSGGGQASQLHEPMPTVMTVDRHAIVIPKLEEWCFRMFKPPEIGVGMAFPPSYVVLGNDREKVKQYGNAVTPPVMTWLIARCLESLYPEREAYDPWAEWMVA